MERGVKEKLSSEELTHTGSGGVKVKANAVSHADRVYPRCDVMRMALPLWGPPPAKTQNPDLTTRKRS